MGYIGDLEAEVRKAIHEGADEEMLVKLFKEKVWESYKNGQKSVKTQKKNPKPKAPEITSIH